MLIDLAFIGMYVVLIGGATFFEQAVSRDLDALLLDALLRVGTFALACLALLAQLLVLCLTSPNTPGLLLSHVTLPILAAGIGIGLLAGMASICYCLALDRLPSFVVASAANGYLAVTVVLGIILLHDPFTLLTAGGLALTGAGILVLAAPHGPTTSGASAAVKSITARLGSLGWIGGYILLAGTSAFLEKPILAHLSATELNGLVAVGMLAVGGVGLLLRDHAAQGRPGEVRQARGAAVGIGAVIGLAVIFYYLGLARVPVSLAATLSNTYIVVPVILATVVRHTPLGRRKLIGVAVILAGATLLALAPR